MADPIEFTRNYRDLSQQHGFEFEFFCDRCGNGFRTRFKPFALGSVTGVLDTASSLLGGLFGQAANVSGRMTEAQREQARQQALIEAIAELKPHFKQCPKCMAWVCTKTCWNDKRGLCKNCAPDLQVEMSAMQSARAVEKAFENSAADAEDTQLVTGSWSDKKVASCPTCSAPLAAGAKFCPECGAKINAEKHCTECGAKLAPGAKFCAECGTKAG